MGDRGSFEGGTIIGYGVGLHLRRLSDSEITFASLRLSGGAAELNWRMSVRDLRCLRESMTFALGVDDTAGERRERLIVICEHLARGLAEGTGDLDRDVALLARHLRTALTLNVKEDP